MNIPPNHWPQSMNWHKITQLSISPPKESVQLGAMVKDLLTGSSSFTTVHCNVTERSCSAAAVHFMTVPANHSEPSVNQASVFSVS